MSRSPIRLATFLAAGALALMTVAPGAAQTPGTVDAPRIVPVSVGAGMIDPATVEVLPGETIRFLVVNVSDAEAELIVGPKSEVDADTGDNLREAENLAASGEGAGAILYTFEGAGPWGYGDQIGDHYAAGAKGDIVIVDALTPAASMAPAASTAP
jgi:plastocyanin